MVEKAPNGIAANVLDKALDRYSERLERDCERRRGDKPSDWRENVRAREDRWRRTALGEEQADDSPQFRSPPPQIGPTIDED